VCVINSAINIMNTVDDEDDRACASCGVVEEVDNTIKNRKNAMIVTMKSSTQKRWLRRTLCAVLLAALIM
jgi:hypothetical protein